MAVFESDWTSASGGSSSRSEPHCIETATCKFVVDRSVTLRIGEQSDAHPEM